MAYVRACDTYGLPTSLCSGRVCVKSLRSSYTWDCNPRVWVRQCTLRDTVGFRTQILSARTVLTRSMGAVAVLETHPAPPPAYSLPEKRKDLYHALPTSPDTTRCAGVLKRPGIVAKPQRPNAMPFVSQGAVDNPGEFWLSLNAHPQTAALRLPECTCLT